MIKSEIKSKSFIKIYYISLIIKGGNTDPYVSYGI